MTDFSGKKTILPNDAQKKLAALCAKTETCRFEARKKCRKWGLDADSTENIIHNLCRLGFIDDARYARAFAHDKNLFSGWGRNKIRFYLTALCIESRFIDEAINALNTDVYMSVLDKIASPKVEAIDISDRLSRSKLIRVLLSRGFTSSEISQWLNEKNKNS